MSSNATQKTPPSIPSSQPSGHFNLLKAIRCKGLRQKDFAKLVGDDPSVVSRIINGTWRPDEERKIRYAKALKCRPEDLFSAEVSHG
jgi:transcriptional regulator with XRE-family HTH domain